MKVRKNVLHQGLYLIIIIVTTLGFAACSTSTPALKGPKPISTLEKIKLGGIDQWLLIRSRDLDKPLLLFLHGGPGSPAIPLGRTYMQRLEKYFIVVNWDQRGTGKSYHSNIPPESMTIEQFLKDTNELVQYLKNRFNKEKIYLVGRSWGSFLGIYTIQAHPEDFYAYVSLGQIINTRDGGILAFQYMLDRARAENDKKAIQILESIDPAKLENLLEADFDDFHDVLHKYISFYYEEENQKNVINTVLAAPEYNLGDLIRTLRGMKFSIKSITPLVAQRDVRKDVKRIEVPIYFITSPHDWITPAALVEEFYNNLDAPTGKHLFSLNYSSHGLNYEEPEEFADIMINVVLKKVW